MKKYFIFFCCITLVQIKSNGQDKVDILMTKLNKLYNESLIIKNKPTEIYINKGEKTIDIESFVVPLTSYTAYYQEMPEAENNKKKYYLCIKCKDDSACIFDPNEKRPNDYTKRVCFSLKSKKACYDLINIIAELKAALEK